MTAPTTTTPTGPHDPDWEGSVHLGRDWTAIAWLTGGTLALAGALPVAYGAAGAPGAAAAVLAYCAVEATAAHRTAPR